MVAVAVVTTPNMETAPDTVARRVFEDAPGIEIEVERFVPLDNSAIPYFWVRGEDIDAFERALEGYDEVDGVELLERAEKGAFYRIDWEVDSPVIECIQRSGARLMEAHGTAARWKLTVWFEPDTDASTLLECCRDQGVPIEVDRLHTMADQTSGLGPMLTSRQREALTAAYELGYFERPRAVTQGELATHLDISAAAVGSRLRRGTSNIVEYELYE